MFSIFPQHFLYLHYCLSVKNYIPGMDEAQKVFIRVKKGSYGLPNGNKQTASSLPPLSFSFFLCISWCQKERGWFRVDSPSFCVIFRWDRQLNLKGMWAAVCFSDAFSVAEAQGRGEEALGKNNLGLSEWLKPLFLSVRTPFMTWFSSLFLSCSVVTWRSECLRPTAVFCLTSNLCENKVHS